MRIIDVLWIEDDSEFTDGHLANFKEDRDELGFTIVPWQYESKDEFDKNAHHELDSLSMELAIIDNNLPGINGNEIIKQIRSHEANKNLPIIFYSYAKNAIELKELIENTLDEKNPSNIFYCHKNDLVDTMLQVINN